MAINLIFDVLKFSEALSPAGPSKIDWTHLSGSNLQVVLQGSDSRSSDATLSMDVVQGTTYLERLNVAEYVDRSKLLREARNRSGVSLKLEELPIFGITKEPVMALRYQLNDKARRLQLRLKKSDDFQVLMSILSNRGMEFSQQRPTTGRPDTTSDRPTTAQQDGRLLTSGSSRIVQNGHSSIGPRPSPFKIPGIEAGSLSQRPVGNVLPPTNSTGRLVAPARESSRDACSQAHNSPQPFSAQQWPSHLSRALRPDVYDIQQGFDARLDEDITRINANSEASGHGAEKFFNFSATSPGAGQGIFERPPQMGLSSGGIQSGSSGLVSDSSEARPSTAVSVTSGASIFADTLESEIPPPRALPFKSTGNLRPSSAISIPSDPSLTITLSHGIPPHRELPFKRPGSRTGGSGASRPGSALPPSSKKIRSLEDRPKTASMVQKRSANANADGLGSCDPSGPMKRIRLPVQSSLSFTAPKSPLDENQSNPKEALPMKDLIFGGGRFSSSKRPRVDSTMDAPHEIKTPPMSAEKQQLATIPQGTRFPIASTTLSADSNDVRSRLDSTIYPSINSQELDLDQYASQTPEARQTAIDKFMVDMLQNPSFTTLCEDIERCWRKIALGL